MIDNLITFSIVYYTIYIIHNISSFVFYRCDIERMTLKYATPTQVE